MCAGRQRRAAQRRAKLGRAGGAPRPSGKLHRAGRGRAAVYGEATAGERLGRTVTGEEGRGGGRVLTGVLQGFGQRGNEEVDGDDRRGRRGRG